ncbi:hypothetical protein KR067_013122, partial [Drosophila pandora]
NTMDYVRASTCCHLILIALIQQPSAAAVHGSVFKDLTTPQGQQIMRSAKSAQMLSFMDTDANPCDDFYGYACGNFARFNGATPEKDTSIGQDMFAGYLRRVRQLLNQPRMSTDWPMETLVKYFYESCLDTTSLRIHQRSRIISVLREFRGMPAVEGDSWTGIDFDPLETMAQLLSRYGKLTLLGVYVSPDYKNSQINRLYLGQRNDLVPIDESAKLAKKLEIQMRLQNLEASIAKDLQNYLGVGAKEANDIAKNLYDFEGKLFEGDSSISFEDGHSLYSLAELEEKYISYLNFTEYFGLIFGEGNIPEKLYVYNDEFLDNALALMKNTPSATQANYILWHLLEDYLVDSNDKDLSKWCVGQTRKYFGQLTDHLVYKRYRSSKAEEEVLSVWEEIRGIFREHLKGDKLDWITNATRQLAIKKLDRMELNISSYDSVDFEKLFGPVEIDRNNYVANIQHLLSAKAMEAVEKLNIPGSSLDTPETLSFTPAYNVQENSITIPVALLQPRYFWSDEYPEALKYATLGYLIGHEMVHGFDDSGRSYDASGNLAPWWDIKSRYEFEERRKCFQAQYHAYKYGGSKLPETENQAENIADNAGIKFAYIAYEKWLGQQTEERKEREIMKGLDLNSRQLFFLGYAQLWCDDVHKLIRSTIVKNDEHAPNIYRVIGSLSNFQEFSWVYNCSQEAPMDPEYKCAIY